MKNLDLKNVSTDTWVRTISSFIFIINMLLNSFGIDTIQIDDGTIEQVVSGIVGVIGAGVLIRSWWKNNSFTKGAQAGDKIKNEVNKETKEAV